MNSVASITSELSASLPYTYYRPVVFIVKTPDLLKARLYVRGDLFVQIYRNDITDSTSFVLISQGKRIYARDQIRGSWHRHPTHDPDFHNHSLEGITPIRLSAFLFEVDTIFKTMGIS